MMSGTLIAPLWAVHIADGILEPSWILAGFVVAGLLMLLGAWRIRDEEIPQVALLTAAFFVASLVHVRVGQSSVHLLLNGLVGVILGRRAALAIPVGLFLQAALIGHGGFTSLGVNSCVMGLPALLAWLLFALLQHVPWGRFPWLRAGLVAVSILGWLLCLVYGLVLLFSPSETGMHWAATVTLHPATLASAAAVGLLAAWMERKLENEPEFAIGLLIGQTAVLSTTLLACLALAYGAREPESWQKLVQLLFVAHVPIALIEGIVLGFTFGFLARVKPEMLGWTLPKETLCSVDSVP